MYVYTEGGWSDVLDDCIDYGASLPPGLSDWRVHQAQIWLFSKQFSLFKDAAAVWQLQQRESEEQHITETRAGLLTPTSAASNIQTTHFYQKCREFSAFGGSWLSAWICKVNWQKCCESGQDSCLEPMRDQTRLNWGTLYLLLSGCIIWIYLYIRRRWFSWDTEI